MAAPTPFPSVLLAGPVAAPPPAPPHQPTPSTAEPVPEGHIRCSQCKKHKPPHDFPTRLVNLQPYQVCLAHAWYWTVAKKAVHWAPSETTPLEVLDGDVKSLKEGGEGAADKWMVEAGKEDRAALVERIAGAAGWKTKQISLRKSSAKPDSPPHPTFQYQLSPLSADDTTGNFKLTLYQHDVEHKYTLTIRPDDKNKQAPGPWARPGRVRGKKKQESEAPVEEKDEEEMLVPSMEEAAPTKKGKGKAKEMELALGPGKRKELGTTASFDLLLNAATAVNGDIVVDAPAKRSNPADEDAGQSFPPRSSQEMPPPPVPPARPAKKARRVEPSLISTTPSSTYASANFSSSLPTAPPTQSPFSAASASQPWAHFLSFPDLLGPASPASPSQKPPPPPPTMFDYSSDAGIMALLNTLAAATSPAASSSSLPTLPPHQPITLADLLANPLLEPPNIPLPPRQSAAPPLNSSSSFPSAPTPTPSTSAPRVPSSLRQSTSLAEVPAPSKAGKAFDDAVAEALGTPPASVSSGAAAVQKRSRRAGSEDLASGSEDDEEEDEDYYEDSIPDDSSNEGDGAGEGGKGGKLLEAADDDGASSFFESSAEETDYEDGEGGYSGSSEGSRADNGGGGGEDEDEEEEDWLAGFVSRQMPGMAVDEDEAEEEAADQYAPGGAGSRRRSFAGEEEEIDELEDSGAE
ncbi:hypothetical protein JCM8097_008668 [Rhodosporidiobolus ruineniae]